MSITFTQDYHVASFPVLIFGWYCCVKSAMNIDMYMVYGEEEICRTIM